MRTKGRLLSAANHEPRPQTQSETPHSETGVERHWFRLLASFPPTRRANTSKGCWNLAGTNSTIFPVFLWMEHSGRKKISPTPKKNHRRRLAATLPPIATP